MHVRRERTEPSYPLLIVTGGCRPLNPMARVTSKSALQSIRRKDRSLDTGAHVGEGHPRMSEDSRTSFALEGSPPWTIYLGWPLSSTSLRFSAVRVLGFLGIRFMSGSNSLRRPLVSNLIRRV